MEQQFFNKVLQNVPSTWDTKNYDNKVYHTIPLSSYGSTREEYSDIESFFTGKARGLFLIKEIHRIQNPFAYGAFQLRKEQIECSTGRASEARELVVIGKDKLQEALTYNLDTRRINVSQFYNSSSVSPDEKCFIVKRKLESYHYDTRDSDYYPEYVIYFNSL